MLWKLQNRLSSLFRCGLAWRFAMKPEAAINSASQEYRRKLNEFFHEFAWFMASRSLQFLLQDSPFFSREFTEGKTCQTCKSSRIVWKKSNSGVVWTWWSLLRNSSSFHPHKSFLGLTSQPQILHAKKWWSLEKSITLNIGAIDFLPAFRCAPDTKTKQFHKCMLNS